MGDLERATMSNRPPRDGALSILPDEKQRHQWPPELKLLAAILEEAIMAYGRRATAMDRYGRSRAQLEAQMWFCSDDRTWPFSFLNLCDYLKLDPGAVLKAVGVTRPDAPRPGIAAGLRQFRYAGSRTRVQSS